MTQFSDLLIGSARLKILQLLRKTNGYALNHQVIADALESMGLNFSRDQVRSELGWLAEQRALTICDVGTMIVAELTERGHDVAKGVSQIRGIDRPLPGSGL